jgi:aarF domain-containing kinase
LIDLQWASIGYNNSITDPRTISRIGYSAWLRDRFDTVVFRITLGVIDLAFWATQIRQCEWDIAAFWCWLMVRAATEE